MKEVQIKGYECEKCGKIHSDKLLAELCCKEYHCEDCGKVTEKYWFVCPECRTKRIFNKAEKMTYKQYCEKYPDYPIFDIDEENCYWELEDLIDRFEEGEEPQYCYGALKERVEVNIDCAIDNAQEELPEDCYFDNTKELIDFVEKWNQKNGQYVYYCNNKIVILISEEDNLC